MSKECEVVLVTKKLQTQPDREWILLREERTSGRVTDRRVMVRLMTFDRATGNRIDAHRHYSSWYRYSIKPESIKEGLTRE